MSRTPPWLGTGRRSGNSCWEGASGADVMAALTEFVDGLIIGRYRDAMRNEADPNTEIN